MEILDNWKTRRVPRRWLWLMGAGICLLAVVFAAAFFIARRTSSSAGNHPATESSAPGAVAAVAQVEKTFKISQSGAADQAVQKAPPKNPQPAEVPNRIETEEIAEKSSIVTNPTSEAPLRPEKDASQSAKSQSTDPPPAPDPDTGVSTPIQPSDIGAVIGRLKHDASRKSAVHSLLTIWEQPRPNPELIPAEAEDAVFFDIAARQYGLRCFATQDNNWDLVRQLNLPAIIGLKNKNANQTVYLTLAAWTENTLHLDDGKSAGGFETDFDTIRPYLEGSAYVYWNNAIGFDMIISYGADSRAVLVLKNLLRKIGYDQIPKSPDFDLATQAAVLDFQARHNLNVDGLVGTLTKIKLLQEAQNTTMPELKAAYRQQS